MAHNAYKSFTSKTHILLVDKDGELLDSTAQVLEHFAYKVAVAKSEPEALSLLFDGTNKLDLVLLEISGPLLLQETSRKKIPTFCQNVVVSNNLEDVMVENLTLESRECFYLQKLISLEMLKSPWIYATKDHMSMAKTDSEEEEDKRLEIISEQYKENETESETKNENNDAANPRTRPMDEEINGDEVYESDRKGKGKAPYDEMDNLLEKFAAHASSTRSSGEESRDDE